MEVERLRSKVYTEQINVSVTPEMKQRLLMIKREKNINVAAEIRKMIERLVPQLESLD